VTLSSRKLGLLLLLALISASVPALAQEDENPLGISLLNTVGDATQAENITGAISLLLLITILTLAPAILVMMTSFTRIIVVLGFLRQAMATQQSPPNQVLVGLALFLTFFIMYPVGQEIYTNALQPYSDDEITQGEAWDRAQEPIRAFMFRQVRPKDVALFINIAEMERPETREDVPLRVLIPAFVISELRTAFIIGFYIYIPFLIIDMVVASTLMAMGMMMLPPVFVSLPFKIIMFVLADGWFLLVESLVRSFG
jgi:flagellar biosynthesis protein FliP